MKMRFLMMVTVMAMVLGLEATPLAALAQQTEDMVQGRVTKVDAAAGKVTIKHGPLKKFGMDEDMTMVFRVEDSAMLNKVKAGDAIRFVPERINGQFTARNIEKADE